MSLAIYSVSRQKNLMENYSQELTDTLNEAMNVRIELEDIMENAVQISQTFVDQFEEKISRTSQASESSLEIRAAELSFSPDDIIISSSPESFNQTLNQEELKAEVSPSEEIISLEEASEEMTAELVIPSVSHEVRLKKTRIYILAKELQLSNQALIDIVRNLGIEVYNHMNALDERQVSLVINTVQNTSWCESEKKNTEVPEAVKPVEVHPVIWTSFQLADEAETNKQAAAISTEAPPGAAEAALPLQGIGFTIEELRNAHPYIAVKTLYDNGYPIRDIAKLLGRGQGEVSLILNLSKKKASVI